MFEATHITSNADYEYFIRATEPSAMAVILKSGLKKIWGDGFNLKNLRIPRVSTTKDNGMMIQYELSVENIPFGSAETIFLCGKLLEHGKRFDDYVGKLKGDTIIVKDIGLAIPIFPYDRKMPALMEIENIVNSPQIVEKISAKLKVVGPVSSSVLYNVLGYRLEKRAVFRIDYEIVDKSGKKFNSSLIAKMFKPSSSNRAYNAFKVLEENGFQSNSQDNINIPEIVYFDEKNGILMTEYFDGITLRTLPKPDIYSRICGVAGTALNKLHNLSISDLPPFSSHNELETLETQISLLSKMFPSVIDDFKNAVELLKERREFDDDNIRRVCSHRDFYDKQFLFSADRSVIIDCDNLAMADPALDYGNFAAHLELRKTQYPGNEDLFDNGREEFEKTYGNFDNTDFKQRAIWYEAATLTRLSMLYLLRPSWRDISPYILQKAFSLLN